MGQILVVDDEEGIRGMLEVVLRRDGHEVVTAASGREASAALDAHPIDVVITDLRMDDGDGLGVLDTIHRGHKGVFTIVMTAYADSTTAAQAMRLGAYNFIAKPFDNSIVRSLVRRALAAREHHLANQGEDDLSRVHLVGASRPMLEIQELIEQVSTTDASILITGESGTGKELIASAVHYSSLRADRSMMRVNSGALTPSLLESELFGHVKGAFTGAVKDRPGLFELADTGTLFLDEVGDLAMETQVKLLRVLEAGEYLPVGGSKVQTCDVRVVAATNKDLKAMVKAGTFREDLYYRLAVISVHMPALRQRSDDIPLLAGHLLSRHAVRLRRGVEGFSDEAMEAMASYRWAGNIRELDNRIQRGVALTAEGKITVDALFGDVADTETGMWRAIRGEHTASFRRETTVRHQSAPSPALERRRTTTISGPPNQDASQDLAAHLRSGATIDLEGELRRHEKVLLQAALDATDGTLTEAAKRLGLTFRQIRYKAKQLGLR
ncbi:MAG: sigma-54 dependent transcriptional regulator [Planctomycetota bacterium]|jgi:DNA-binding NtrC family response regulator|nr:sigma-54 dependent transcriptional regulator [Planctomycetota bacterium]